MTQAEIDLLGYITLVIISAVYFVTTALSEDKNLPLSLMLSITLISVIKNNSNIEIKYETT